MRILIDTNIIIHLEDSSRVLEESFAEVLRLCQKNNHLLLVHPASVEDIQKDSDTRRQLISVSRLKKYNVLEKPPIPNNEDLLSLDLKTSSDNDRIDNLILFSIYKNAANILITEDREIHKKAKALGLTDSVHYVQQAAIFLRRLHSEIPISLPDIQEVSLYNINLKDTFFDTLRQDYPGYDEWFNKASRAGRKAWVYKSGDQDIKAICIYKIETNPLVTDDNQAIEGQVLKLCTFKVGEPVRGIKIGELFFKAAFRYATDNKREHIYLTMNPHKQAYLMDLCLDFGFKYIGTHKGDHVYVKEHPAKPVISDLPAVEYHKRYFPHFKCQPEINKFILPILPSYHRILFPDNQLQADFLNSLAPGNAIKQAYLSNASLNKISPGDVLLFYRSRDLRAITSIGVVEVAETLSDADKIAQMVSKRTVYSYDDIKKMANKETKVILFRLALHLGQPLPYQWLLEEGIINGYVQTITQISDTSFKKIASKWGINNCVYAD